MEERIKVTSIIKSSDPEKLIVHLAVSLQNEIRFYLNDTQYFTAIENESGCSIRLGEEQSKECDKKSKISIIRENLGEFIKLFSITIGISTLTFIGLLHLARIIDNILVYLIIASISYFVINMINVVIMESVTIAPKIKSKHSAEHMMVNFLENNKRLPKSIEEVKKSSRFSPECGSRKLIAGIAENLVQGIFAAVFTGIVSAMIQSFSFNDTTNSLVILTTYFLVNFVVGKRIIKYDMLGFIIKPIKKVLTNIAQCANTTSKVKDSDIILAYCVAKPWLQVVYPEFYNESEDIFWKQYLTVNNEKR